jgi:hypothetical protein
MRRLVSPKILMVNQRFDPFSENVKSTHRTFSGFRFLGRLEQSEAVERLERFEPNPRWLARGVGSLRAPILMSKAALSL